MKRRVRRFADDGWAFWVEGDDTSAFYINQWINPHGCSFVDVAAAVRFTGDCRGINIYIPFEVEESDIEDIAFHLGNPAIFTAVFDSRGMVDLWKNECTSLLAYHGRVVDLLHISKTNVEVKKLSEGSLIRLSMDDFKDCLYSDEVYIYFRLPHKSLNEVFALDTHPVSLMQHVRDLFVSPVLSEKYGYSVRINEVRMLPPEISKIGALSRQKLDRAVVTVYLNEDYQISVANCHRTHRLEENLYTQHVPKKFDLDDVVVYHSQQTREENLRGHFNFYFDIHRERIAGWSIFTYAVAVFLLELLAQTLYTEGIGFFGGLF